MWKVNLRLAISFLLVIALLAVSLALQGGFFVMRYYLATEVWNADSLIIWAVILSAVGQGFLVIVFNQLAYKWIGFLTRFENHKTVPSFETSFFTKLLIFRFFNTFTSIIYVAFAKQSHYGCIEQENGL